MTSFSSQVLLLAALVAVVDASFLDVKSIDTQKLLENAQPKSKHEVRRNLQDSGLTGAQSIIFRSCQTLAVQPDNDGDMSREMEEDIENGYLSGVKSYVEFDVCTSDYCNSGDGNRTTYITSLADYMTAFSRFLPVKQEEYCQGCIDNNDYCEIEYYPGSYEQVYKENAYEKEAKYYQASQRSGGWQRHLEQQGEVVYKPISCNRCRDYDCLYNGGNNEYYKTAQEMSLQWIQNMASCYQDDQNPVFIDGSRASFGFICNSEGTGVEIGVFADEDCTLYANQLPFGNVATYQQDNLFWFSKGNVEYIFNTQFSCHDTEVVYTSPEDYDEYGNYLYAQKGDDDDDDNNNNNNAASEASEYCQNVFAGDMTPITMDDCVAYRKLQEDRRTLQEEEEEEEENQDVDGENYDGYAYGNEHGYYNLTAEEAQDIETVCATLMANGGEGNHAYNRWGSGSVYRYTNPGTPYTQGGSTYATPSENSNNWLNSLDSIVAKANKSNGNGTSRGLSVAAIVMVVLTLGGAGYVVASRVLKKSKDSKEEPILEKETEEKEGTMA